MSIETVRAYLAPFGVADRIQEFPVSSATVELAAQALGIEGARIAKSLSFQMGEQTVIVVAAGDARVDNRKFKAQFQTKAKMLSHEETAERTGHAVGGVCPFALPEGVRVYLDISLKRFSSVYPAAGSGNSALELSCQELERCSSGFDGWVDVCQGWNSEA